MFGTEDSLVNLRCLSNRKRHESDGGSGGNPLEELRQRAAAKKRRLLEQGDTSSVQDGHCTDIMPPKPIGTPKTDGGQADQKVAAASSSVPNLDSSTKTPTSSGAETATAPAPHHGENTLEKTLRHVDSTLHMKKHSTNSSSGGSFAKANPSASSSADEQPKTASLNLRHVDSTLYMKKNYHHNSDSSSGSAGGGGDALLARLKSIRSEKNTPAVKPVSTTATSTPPPATAQKKSCTLKSNPFLAKINSQNSFSVTGRMMKSDPTSNSNSNEPAATSSVPSASTDSQKPSSTAAPAVKKNTNPFLAKLSGSTGQSLVRSSGKAFADDPSNEMARKKVSSNPFLARISSCQSSQSLPEKSSNTNSSIPSNSVQDAKMEEPPKNKANPLLDMLNKCSSTTKPAESPCPSSAPSAAASKSGKESPRAQTAKETPSPAARARRLLKSCLKKETSPSETSGASQQQQQQPDEPKKQKHSIRFDLEQNTMEYFYMSKEDLERTWMSFEEAALVKHCAQLTIQFHQEGVLNTQEDCIRGLEVHADPLKAQEKSLAGKAFVTRVLQQQRLLRALAATNPSTNPQESNRSSNNVASSDKSTNAVVSSSVHDGILGKLCTLLSTDDVKQAVDMAAQDANEALFIHAYDHAMVKLQMQEKEQQKQKQQQQDNVTASSSTGTTAATAATTTLGVCSTDAPETNVTGNNGTSASSSNDKKPSLAGVSPEIAHLLQHSGLVSRA